MKTVNLGDLEVSAIGLVCMGMSQAYGKADPVESERTLHRALDIGVTFLDTANVYGLGHNEELVGRILKGRRTEMQLATKFGIVEKDGKRGIDGHPDQVTVCIKNYTITSVCHHTIPLLYFFQDSLNTILIALNVNIKEAGKRTRQSIYRSKILI